MSLQTAGPAVPGSDTPTGVLLVNPGTPESLVVADVPRYLKAFLRDPRAVELSRPAGCCCHFTVFPGHMPMPRISVCFPGWFHRTHRDGPEPWWPGSCGGVELQQCNPVI